MGRGSGLIGPNNLTNTGVPPERLPSRMQTPDPVNKRRIQANDGLIVFDTDAGDGEVFLPDLPCIPFGKSIRIVKLGPNALDITPLGSQEINETAGSFSLPSDGEAIILERGPKARGSWYVTSISIT